jgi:hypothetical protein
VTARATARPRRQRPPAQRSLPWVVLALWTATEATGLKMLTSFARGGGFHDETVAPSYPAALVANGTLGTAGISLWALFLATRHRALAWAACGQLTTAIAIGTALAVPWHRARRAGRPTPRGGGRAAFRYLGGVEAGHAIAAWGTALLAATAAARADAVDRRGEQARRAWDSNPRWV